MRPGWSHFFTQSDEVVSIVAKPAIAGGDLIPLNT